MNNNGCTLSCECVDPAENRLVEGGGRLKVKRETPPNRPV